jgi:hypothetical protein
VIRTRDINCVFVSYNKNKKNKTMFSKPVILPGCWLIIYFSPVNYFFHTHNHIADIIY